MANPQWYMNSLPLKFLFAPFKAAYTTAIIILIIFGTSFVLQTWLHQPNLLAQELAHHELTASTDTTIRADVAKAMYRGLSTVFFDWTGINHALSVSNPNDPAYKFQTYLIHNRQYLTHLDDTLKVVSIRIGNISLFWGLALLLSLLALVDGLVMRAVRQKNAGRESAGIYHRAKYWRVGIIWSSTLLYLCLPVYVSPYLLTIPVAACALMLFLQAKYLKKYL